VVPLGRILSRMELLREYLLRRSEAAQRKYDNPDSRALIRGYIKSYGIDTSVIADPIDSFATLNHFFYRRLKPNARPIAMCEDPTVITSPADCRLHVFEKAYDDTFFIKSRKFTVSSLLGSDRAQTHQLLTRYRLSDPIRTSMVLCRLAPTDYHRFHSPIDGVIGDYWTLGTDLHSVKPIVVNEDVPVYTDNRRTVLLIESPIFGVMVYVMVGATEVGSIVLSVKTGDRVRKGDEIGHFAYGGSALVLLFPTPTFGDYGRGGGGGGGGGGDATVVTETKQMVQSNGHVPNVHVTTEDAQSPRSNIVVNGGGGGGMGLGRSRFVLDADLITNTYERQMETLIQMGSSIGRVIFVPSTNTTAEPSPVTPGKGVSG